MRIAPICALVLCCLAVLARTAQAQQVERVEPPHWWTGFAHAEVQLMLHGSGIAGLQPELDYPGVELARVERSDNPNYLFLYLRLAPDAPAGHIDIRLRGDGGSVEVPFPLYRRNPDPDWARGFTAADAIYLVTPDRFANGDPANDNVLGMGDAADRGELCGRHGGDLAGLTDTLDYIQQMGFTAVWLNPVLENRMQRCSYHGYSTTDFYRVDPRFGSNADYRAMADRARELGMGLIMDMITNHIGSGHWWMNDLPAADWLNHPQERPITSHIHATVQDPYASAHDTAAFTDGWFVDTMPDLNQRNVLLGDYLVQNAIWWIETLGLAGIRHDTHPYPDKQFLSLWTGRIMAEYPDFNIVGEEWLPHPVMLSYWQRGKVNRDGYVSQLPSLMDFPLQENLRRSLVAEAADGRHPWRPVYETLAMDTVYPDPFNLVIFPDNHDMSRVFTQLGEDPRLWRMAMVFNATMRGIPQFYYGTEILMRNRASGDHGLIRSDFPGGWPEDDRNAFTGEGLDESERAAQDFTRRLLQWRRDSAVIHSGALMQFVPDGDSYVYFRHDPRYTVMVAFNRGDAPVSLELDRFAERLRGARSAREVLRDETVSLEGPLVLEPRSVRLLEIRHH